MICIKRIDKVLLIGLSLLQRITSQIDADRIGVLSPLVVAVCLRIIVTEHQPVYLVVACLEILYIFILILSCFNLPSDIRIFFVPEFLIRIFDLKLTCT